MEIYLNLTEVWVMSILDKIQHMQQQDQKVIFYLRHLPGQDSSSLALHAKDVYGSGSECCEGGTFFRDDVHSLIQKGEGLIIVTSFTTKLSEMTKHVGEGLDAGYHIFCFDMYKYILEENGLTQCAANAVALLKVYQALAAKTPKYANYYSSEVIEHMAANYEFSAHILHHTTPLAYDPNAYYWTDVMNGRHPKIVESESDVSESEATVNSEASMVGSEADMDNKSEASMVGSEADMDNKSEADMDNSKSWSGSCMSEGDFQQLTSHCADDEDSVVDFNDV